MINDQTIATDNNHSKMAATATAAETGIRHSTDTATEVAAVRSFQHSSEVNNDQILVIVNYSQ